MSNNDEDMKSKGGERKIPRESKNIAIACIFGWNPLALIWLVKMKKVRLWSLLLASAVVNKIIVPLVIAYLFFNDFINEKDLAFVEMFSNLIAIMLFLGSISLMYNWLQEYDRRKFDDSKIKTE